jgi:hypothetical protein
MLKFLYDNLSDASENINKIMRGFLDETEGELWDSEEDLVNYYQQEENYAKLKRGEVGGNLIYKYKSKNLIEAGIDWADFIESQLYNLIKLEGCDENSLAVIKSEIAEISAFCKLKIDGLLNIEANVSPINKIFKFDVLKWVDNGAEKRLSEYKFNENNEDIYFQYTPDQINIRNDLFSRYGTDINALSKIVTRISSLETQFRKVRYTNEKHLRDIYKKVGEKFTRYAMSG